MCPVCMSGGRQVTWRVHYITANTAALYTPRGRLSSNARATKHIPQHERHSNSPQDVQHQKPPQPGMYPVGGCVLSPQKAKNIGQVITMAYVTASLKIATDTNTTAEVMQDCNRVRTPGTMARHKCPLQVLLWSDRRSKGATMSKRVEDVAWFARQTLGIDDALGDDSTNFEGDVVESEEWLPTPIVSVSAMRPSGWRDVSTAARRSVSVPATWEASAQAWVLFDMDDMCNLEEDGVVLVAAHKIVLAARRNQELSGRCLVMQTGPHGLHVWSELREVRDEPRVWFKKEETREWYSDLGLKLLQASHRAGAKGGKIDMSSCSAGRFARRPGWRLLEDGTLFRSHIVMHVPSVVKGRKPRKGER